MSPPNYLLVSHPSYYITVNMDCFTPSSYITTVMRNSWQGDIVGDFEWVNSFSSYWMIKLTTMVPPTKNGIVFEET